MMPVLSSVIFILLLASKNLDVLFALMQKEPKKSSPARSSAGRAGQRTWTFIRECKYILLSNWLFESCCVAFICNLWRRCLFRLPSLMM